MPHITIEFSANLEADHDITALVDQVHQAALDTGLPPLAGLRTRAVSRTHYRIASGEGSFGFVALIARIGPGRTAEQKKHFITALIDAAQASFDPCDHQIAFSVEVQEIDPDYRINRNQIRPYLEQLDHEENSDV